MINTASKFSLNFNLRPFIVVYAGVLTKEECAATRGEVWDYLEAGAYTHPLSSST
jgi:hypothetical protein